MQTVASPTADSFYLDPSKPVNHELVAHAYSIARNKLRQVRSLRGAYLYSNLAKYMTFFLLTEAVRYREIARTLRSTAPETDELEGGRGV